jgi:hypothetical protein
MKTFFNFAVLLCALTVIGWPASAQTPVPPPTPDYQPLSDQQLDQLIGPIALYPDPLMAQILPAATLPTQIVLADRYVTGGGDPSQIEQQPWDASVQAVAHYPNVIKWLDDNLNWTTELGQAFLNQQADVMNSIQRLRASAQNHGNLQTTPQQQVISDGGDIEIVPADPQVIYVPVYDPGVVYYQNPFGAPFITFGIGFGIGGWLNCDFDWGRRHIVVWNHDHPRPPNWWHERGPNRFTGFSGRPIVWHPDHRPTFVGGNRGDRGWNNNPASHRPAPIVTHPNNPPRNFPDNFHGNDIHPVNPHDHTIGPAMHDNSPGRPVVTSPPQHFDTPSRSAENNNTFIGIQSSHDTRDFSNRGQQSLQTIPRSAPPVEHSAPPAQSTPSFNRGGGGGGGNNNSGGGGHSGGRH